MNDNKDLKGISFTSGFFMLAGFALLGLVVGTLAAMPLWTAMTGKSIDELPTEMLKPGNANAIRIVQLLSVVFGFIIPSLFTAWLLHRKPLKLLGFKQPVALKQFLLVLVLMLAALMLAGSFGSLNKMIPIPADWKLKFDLMELEYAQQVGALMGKGSYTDLFAGLFILAFIPALAEEMLFRGGLQNFLTRATRKPWLSILIISVLFSIVHASFYGFFPRLFLGLTLGFIFHYTQSLWLCVTAHFLNNALAITQLFFLLRSGKGIKEAMAEDFPFYWGLLALPFFAVAAWQLYRHSIPTTTETLEVQTND